MENATTETWCWVFSYRLVNGRLIEPLKHKLMQMWQQDSFYSTKSYPLNNIFQIFKSCTYRYSFHPSSSLFLHSGRSGCGLPSPGRSHPGLAVRSSQQHTNNLLLRSELYGRCRVVETHRAREHTRRERLLLGKPLIANVPRTLRTGRTTQKYPPIKIKSCVAFFPEIVLLIVQLLCGIRKNRTGMTRWYDGLITPSEAHIIPDCCSNYFGSTLLPHGEKTGRSFIS